jgi:hypothetical protein
MDPLDKALQNTQLKIMQVAQKIPAVKPSPLLGQTPQTTDTLGTSTQQGLPKPSFNLGNWLGGKESVLPTPKVGSFGYNALSMLAPSFGSKNVPPSPFEAQLPRQRKSYLYTQGNQIIDDRTKQPITLRGSVSDTFRGLWGVNPPSDPDVEGEKKRTAVIKQLGANTVGLYFSDPEYLNKNIDKLDDYINYAKDNDMYVYLMPVARDFNPEMVWTGGEGTAKFRRKNYDELKKLMDSLASRYKDNPNLLYGFGAEPSDMGGPESFKKWNERQIELGNIVRKHNPDAPLLVSDIGWNARDSSDYNRNPFPLPNSIYYRGGYPAANIEGMRNDPDLVERHTKELTANLSSDYPKMYGEFGGFYGGDFSTPEDLEITRKMLDNIKNENSSFTGYQLDLGGLSLFNNDGSLNEKGKLYAQYFK